MDYENERWLKVYTRDTGGWLNLSWQARGLALEISRKLDAEGKLPLGKRGLQALAGVVRGRWEDMADFVAELMADDRFVLLDGNVLLDPGHEERQSARQSAAVRKKTQRDREALSRDVTRSHAPSRNVTIRSEEIRSEEIRSEEIRSIGAASPPPEPVTKVRRRPETPCPSSEATAIEVASWAAVWKIPFSHAEFARFLDHHRAGDARWRDWAAAWRKWLGNVPLFARGSPGARHVQSAENRSWIVPKDMP